MGDIQHLLQDDSDFTKKLMIDQLDKLVQPEVSADHNRNQQAAKEQHVHSDCK